MVSEAHIEKNIMGLNTEHLEDKINFTELKNGHHSGTFLKQLKHNLHTIPSDCEEGLKELDILLGKKLNWNQDILPSWGLRKVA